MKPQICLFYTATWYFIFWRAENWPICLITSNNSVHLCESRDEVFGRVSEVHDHFRGRRHSKWLLYFLQSETNKKINWRQLKYMEKEFRSKNNIRFMQNMRQGLFLNNQIKEPKPKEHDTISEDVNFNIYKHAKINNVTKFINSGKALGNEETSPVFHIAGRWQKFVKEKQYLLRKFYFEGKNNAFDAALFRNFQSRKINFEHSGWINSRKKDVMCNIQIFHSNLNTDYA